MHRRAFQPIALVLAPASAVCHGHSAKVMLLHAKGVHEVSSLRSRGDIAEPATAIKREKAAAADAVMTFGGDLLSPPLMSGLTRGAPKIDALDAVGIDFALLGNHECDPATPCCARMSGSKFLWLATDATQADARVSHNGIALPIREHGGKKFDFFAITTWATASLSSPADRSNFAPHAEEGRALARRVKDILHDRGRPCARTPDRLRERRADRGDPARTPHGRGWSSSPPSRRTQPSGAPRMEIVPAGGRCRRLAGSLPIRTSRRLSGATTIAPARNPASLSGPPARSSSASSTSGAPRRRRSATLSATPSARRSGPIPVLATAGTSVAATCTRQGWPSPVATCFPSCLSATRRCAWTWPVAISWRRWRTRSAGSKRNIAAADGDGFEPLQRSKTAIHASAAGLMARQATGYVAARGAVAPRVDARSAPRRRPGAGAAFPESWRRMDKLLSLCTD